jgi:hypothetical protein
VPIELPDAIYGPAHWSGDKKFHDESFPYYFFLAGFVRLKNCRSIFEVGTHYGGSTLAMLHGIGDGPRQKLSPSIFLTNSRKRASGLQPC